MCNASRRCYVALPSPCLPLQLRSIPVKNAEDDELEEEADWIYRNAFATPTISLQVTGFSLYLRSEMATILPTLTLQHALLGETLPGLFLE